MSKVDKKYRDAKTGKFLTDKEGQSRDPSKTTRESVPKPGHGDTGR